MIEETVETDIDVAEEEKPALQTYPPEGPEEPIVEFELTEPDKKPE